MQFIVKHAVVEAFLQVGRSCHIVQFKDKKIMLDCGIHPGLTGMDALPFVDMIEADQVLQYILAYSQILNLHSKDRPLAHLSLPLGPRWRLALVPPEDHLPRKVLHDPCHQGHFLLDAQ